MVPRPSSTYADSLYNNRIQAVVFVVKLDSSGKAYIDFCSETCSSIATMPSWCTANQGYSGSTTILDGIYRAYRWNHTGPYAAFQLDIPNSNANGYGLYVPSSIPNGQLLGCSGINIHSRSTTSGSNWSAGCQLIGTGSGTSNEFNAFFKSVTGLNFNPWVWYSSSLYSYDYYGYGWGSSYTVGYYVVDRQLAMIGTDGVKYGSGSLNNVFNTTALGKLTSYSTTAANAAGALDFEYATSQCTFYPAHCQIECTLEGAPINSQPCSVSTVYESETLQTATLGQKFTATGLYKNGYGNYWYRITTSSGKTGYIYGGEVKYLKQIISDVTISDYTVPNGHVQGTTFYINGTIKSTYNKLSSVACYIYKGMGTDSDSLTGKSDTPTINTYTLKNSTVDIYTDMGLPEVGMHTYAIYATYTNYYAEGATTLKSNSDTLTLVESYFYVVPAAVDQSTCQHTNQEYVLQESSCVSNGKSVTACTTCGKITENVTSGGHAYGEWTTTQQPTCTAEGVKTRTCSKCQNVETASIASKGHSYTSKTYAATCLEYERVEYTCTACGHQYNVYADEMMSDWLETKPEGVSDELLETKTQYRYSDYETKTSYSTALDGYTQLSKTWEKAGSGYIHYVASWPSGFDTSHNLYSAYNKTKYSASETATTKVEVSSSDRIVGYIYYHWCRGEYTAGPINRTTSKTEDGVYDTFCAFVANINTIDPSTLPAASDGSVTYAHANCCTDSHWYYYFPVYEQSFTNYNALYTFERWTGFSEWSDEAVTASDTRKVETRTLYRYADAQLGDHNWNEGVCSVCHAACEHDYIDGICTICGMEEPCKDYYLFGFINGEDYGCEGDYATIGEYKFVDGKLTATFASDSYVAVKTSDNHQWYMTDGWLGYEVRSAVLYQTGTIAQADKLYVPGGVEIEFTLADNGDNTFTLSYEVKELIRPTLSLSYPKLSLESEVCYNFYFSATDVDNVVEMGLITFSERLADGTIDDAIEIIPGYIQVGALYRVKTNGIPAKNLGDMIYSRVYAKLSDGTYEYTPTVGYHAGLYAEDILQHSSDNNLKSLVVALMNYGAAAQQYFGYKTDSLMNAFLTEEDLAYADSYASGMVTNPPYISSAKTANFVKVEGGYANMYPKISLGAAFGINCYFKPAKTPDDGLTLYYWSLDDFNAVSKLTVDNATGTLKINSPNSTGEYFAAIENIVAKKVDETLFFAAGYESDGVNYYTSVIAYSVGAYCVDRIANTSSATLKALSEATVVYGFYAKQYFLSL